MVESKAASHDGKARLTKKNISNNNTDPWQRYHAIYPYSTNY